MVHNLDLAEGDLYLATAIHPVTLEVKGIITQPPQLQVNFATTFSTVCCNHICLKMSSFSQPTTDNWKPYLHSDPTGVEMTKTVKID